MKVRKYVKKLKMPVNPREKPAETWLTSWI